MKKTIKYGLFLYSAMSGLAPNNSLAYRQTQHAPLETRAEMETFARKTLKLEENLSGKSAFKIRPV